MASPAGYNYQWIDCNTDEFLGTNSIEFVPPSDGLYYVFLYGDVCEDYSECVEFIAGAVSEAATESIWRIYPQPATDYVSILFSGAPGNALINVHSIDGKLVDSFRNDDQKINVSRWNSGIYMLSCEGHSARLVIE